MGEENVNESQADDQEDEQEGLQLFGDEYQGIGNAGAERFLKYTRALNIRT
jgi:hypothetical protein